MPELPEVETTVRGLRKEIANCTILDVWTDLNTHDLRKADTVSNPKYFPYFKKEVLGRKIISVERRAKNILINLDSGKTILLHMKMTGRLLVTNFDTYVHILFSLSKNKKLAFSDPRKFGKVTLIDTKTRNTSKHLVKLGPEPLDKNFSSDIFIDRLKKKKGAKIKTALMDQSVLVGIGNIYSDEILWRAGVRPDRLVKDTTQKELKLLHRAIKQTLSKGIDFGGDSMSDYRNVYGEKGKFQLHHRAYQRTGEKCQKKNCSGVIIRKIINNRSAHYCSLHQK